MPEIFSRLQQKLGELWKNLENSQKKRIIIMSAILAIALTVGIVVFTRPSYMTIIENADPKEVGEMTKILNENKISAKVENGGKNIVINTRDNDKAQAALVIKGYPKGNGMTFADAFNMITITTTESEKKKLWEQYKVESLISKLKMMDNVESADIELTMPEQSVFVGTDNEKNKPRASVTIKPKEEFTPKQVQGIIMMVAKSVANLDPKDISVVDNNLNPLSSEGDDATSAAGSQYDMKLKVKKQLEKTVYDLFGGQFESFDTLRVSANPILDFNKEVTKSKEFKNPEGMETGALVSSEDAKEKLKNDGASGTPGTDSNPGTSPSYQIGNAEGSSYDKQNSTKNYQYNETLTDKEKAAGMMDIGNSSISVALWYGKRVADDSMITQEFVDQVKKDVSAATGIPLEKVSVNKYKISAPVEPQKSLADMIKEIFNTYGFFALMLIMLVGLIVMAMPKKNKKEEAELVINEQPAMAMVGGPKFIVPETMGEVPEIDTEERSEVKKQIDKFVKQKPDAVAQLLRNWLSDEWD